MVNTNTLPSAKRNELFQSISQLKEYNFLMRWKGEKSLDKGKTLQSLYLRLVTPKRSVVSSKGQGFHSHGGLLGTTEAVHCGVPMLLTPFYGDQFLNSGAIKQRGFGVIVDFSDFDADHITRGLRFILDKK